MSIAYVRLTTGIAIMLMPVAPIELGLVMAQPVERMLAAYADDLDEDADAHM